MVKTCVAAGCNISGVRLLKFSRDKALRKKWVDQVKRHRDKWEPTDYSALCSNHFEESCFMPDTVLMQSLGIGKRKLVLNVMQYPP